MKRELHRYINYYLTKITNSFLFKAWQEFDAQDGNMRSGNFSYSVLLAFLPFTLTISSVVSLMPISRRFVAQIEKLIFSHFLPSTGDFFYQQFNNALHHAKSLSWIGFISLFVTSYITLRVLENSLNQMWHVEKPRKITYAILVYTLFMLLAPLLMGVLLLLQIYTKAYFHINLNIIFKPLSYIIGIFLFTMIYKILPAVKVKFKHALIGGAIAGTLFAIAKWMFVLYVTHFAQYSLLYGTLAVLPIFLLWVYICSLILFFCAQIVYMLGSSFLKK